MSATLLLIAAVGLAVTAALPPRKSTRPLRALVIGVMAGAAIVAVAALV